MLLRSFLMSNKKVKINNAEIKTRVVFYRPSQ